MEAAGDIQFRPLKASWLHTHYTRLCFSDHPSLALISQPHIKYSPSSLPSSPNLKIYIFHFSPHQFLQISDPLSPIPIAFLGQLGQMCQHVRQQQFQQIQPHTPLLEIILVAHVYDPSGPVATRGVEQVMHVVSADGEFGEGVGEEAGDEGVGPVRMLQTHEADAGEQGGGAVHDEGRLVRCGWLVVEGRPEGFSDL